MKCSKCDKKAVWLEPALCSRHYVDWFEKKVADTIQEYKLLKKGMKVCVAASGGKDSMTVLHILKKFGYDVTVLGIDEGIAGYRDPTLKDLTTYCKKHNIPLNIHSFEDLTGKKLDAILAKKDFHPCTICGTFRRHLLNKHAQDFDVLATGHNADDEAQAILMNLVRAQTNVLTRPGPKTTPGQQGLTQRIKPLYFCTEKEIMTYAMIHGLATDWSECPYAPQSFRAQLRDALNEQPPAVKHHVLKQFLAYKEKLPATTGTVATCVHCGGPSTNDTCSSCRLIKIV